MEVSYFLKAAKIIWGSHHLSMLCLLSEPIVEGLYCTSAHADPFHANSVICKVHTCGDNLILTEKYQLFLDLR